MKKIFILGALLFITSIPMVSCTDDDDKDPNFMPPDIVMGGDRKSTRLNSSHASKSRMPSSA